MLDPSDDIRGYTHFPTYRDLRVARPTLSQSLFDSTPVEQSRNPECCNFSRQLKRKPTLLLTMSQRRPLQPCLSPQSPAPSSITRHSQRASEKCLRKNLSDLESRLISFGPSHTYSRAPSRVPSFSSFLRFGSDSKRGSVDSTPSGQIKKQPSLGNEILGIFLKNNGGYLDDSDESDDDEAPPVKTLRPNFTMKRSPFSRLQSLSIRQYGAQENYLKKFRLRHRRRKDSFY